MTCLFFIDHFHSNGTYGEIRNQVIFRDDMIVENVQLRDAPTAAFDKFVRLNSADASRMLIDTSQVDFVDGGELNLMFK